jgi:hypothetical protein
VTNGLDYTGKIPGAILKQQNYNDVFRYLGDPNVWEKAMSLNEVTDLRNAGIRIHLNYEQTADFMLGGYSAGMTFAREARKWANLLGFSPDETIYYSADFEVTDSQIPTILDFLRGACDYEDKQLHRVGVYGEYKVLKAAIDIGYSGWQTNATSWSDGLREPRAIAWQGAQVYVNGVDCDLNEMNPNYTQGTSTMATIPDSIAKKWPNLSGDFPANATFDQNTALIWADAGARYAAYKSDEILNAINDLKSHITTGGIDVNALATAIVTAIGHKLAG